MKVTALIDTGVIEVIATKTSTPCVSEIGDGFCGRYQNENGVLMDVEGTVMEILDVQED